MTTDECYYVLHRATDFELLDSIRLISDSDVDNNNTFSITYPKVFLESQWDIRDFELLLDLTGNLDAPL